MSTPFKLQIRRDTSSTWTTVNPEILEGEICFETDTHKLKIGDGLNINWTSLDYIKVDAANIVASGTRSINTYLRGDNTWAGMQASTTLLDLGNVTGTVLVQASLADIFTMTMTGDITLTISGLPVSPPHSLSLRIKQDATGNHFITWDPIFKFPKDTIPANGTEPGDIEWYTLIFIETDRIDVFKADGPFVS